jgi:glycosyltransferase involved in cell wall biosynthesis
MIITPEGTELATSSPPKISLVIAVYNRQNFLPMTIESILNQTYPDFELILWDDQSTDGSLAIAQDYASRDPRVRVIAANHMGATLSLKAAFELTTGTYLGWVDSDDRLAPTALAETTAVLDSHPEVGMVYTNYQLINAHNQLFGLGRRCTIPYSKNRLLIEFMTFHFRLIRRTAFEQAGGIDPTLDLVADYDVSLRLSEVADVFHLPRLLYDYRIHPHSLSQQQPLETIRNSQQAVENALQRRGLAKQYKLKVELFQQNGRLGSRFFLVKLT